jgi:DNA-binding NtrC family response regulator
VGVTRKTVMETGLVTSSARDRTAARSWRCRVLVDGDTAGPEVGLGARPITVGAHRENDLILADPQVSRRHAELAATPEGVLIRDLDSTNGTFWQGSRIGEAVVPGGSTVRFGNTHVRIDAGDTPTLPPSRRTRFGGLVGSSLPMRELFAVLELASPTEATVLIEGESGTGKELAARAIHDHSPRADVPLVVLDCSAVSEQLVDSHLFGHVRGAFTGATSDRKGAFVEASGGTLFLDEIGELPLEGQTKLLRALEAQTVQPVGSDRPVRVDTRVIAATHRGLAEMVEQKRFRFDLFYRLAVVHVHIPPLRERPEDVAALVSNFYEGRGLESGPIAGDNLARLHAHAWPGNVRELRNVLERAWALSGATGARFADLRLWVQTFGNQPSAGEPIDTSVPFKDAKERWLEVFERRYLAQVFETYARNLTHAAEHAGINRRHFRQLLRKHGIIDG